MRTGRPPKPIEERWKVKYRVENNGCWEWLSSKDRSGYGMIKHSNGLQIKAHRFSWMLHYGEIPRGIFVLHRCDNRGCVNPDHLFLGTHQDNMDDMVEKGRLPAHRGMKNGSSRLTDIDVLEIRADRRTQNEIALEYGISQTQVSHIKLRKQWVHI